jgi:hypothetical protein
MPVAKIQGFDFQSPARFFTGSPFCIALEAFWRPQWVCGEGRDVNVDLTTEEGTRFRKRLIS